MSSNPIINPFRDRCNVCHGHKELGVVALDDPGVILYREVCRSCGGAGTRPVLDARRPQLILGEDARK